MDSFNHILNPPPPCQHLPKKATLLDRKMPVRQGWCYPGSVPPRYSPGLSSVGRRLLFCLAPLPASPPAAPRAIAIAPTTPRPLPSVILLGPPPASLRCHPHTAERSDVSVAVLATAAAPAPATVRSCPPPPPPPRPLLSTAQCWPCSSLPAPVRGGPALLLLLVSVAAARLTGLPFVAVVAHGPPPLSVVRCCRRRRR